MTSPKHGFVRKKLENSPVRLAEFVEKLREPRASYATAGRPVGVVAARSGPTSGALRAVCAVRHGVEMKAEWNAQIGAEPIASAESSPPWLAAASRSRISL